MTGTPADFECSVLTDFTDSKSNSRWTTVNDNVMGGRSRGGYQVSDGRLVFEGDINTNGGGFSSIRWQLPEGALRNAQAIRVRIMTDGRAYKLNLRTGARAAGRQLAYRGDLDAADAGTWREVTAPFSALVPTSFGQVVRSAPPFAPSDAQTLGFILADGQDGAFRAEIARIDVCKLK